MNLDSRIKSKLDILTCFDIEKAKEFVGQKGYFTDFIENYQNLGAITYGTLAEIKGKDNDYPFEEDNHECWKFFIPEIRLKSKEKKYRPYTLKEFFDKFTVGQPIRYRRKGDLLERYLILEGYVDSKGDDKENRYQYIHIGSTPYSLDELFNKYEWQERYTEEFKPFGVEE